METTERSVRFGPFAFDSLGRRVTRDGADVHLTPKAFDLLALLIRAAPRVVPKRELHETLWRNGVVSDATLVGLVKELRRALADPERSSSVIRTVHRVGYAFDAPAEPAVRTPSTLRWLEAGNRRFPLAEGENVVGRDPQSDVQLDFSTVSRRHARIVANDASVMLEDLGSKNGTTVEGLTLSGSVCLHDGDRIGFGQSFVVYRESASGYPTATQVSSARSL